MMERITNAAKDGYPTEQATQDAAGGMPTITRQFLAIASVEYRLGVRSRWPVALTGVFLAFALGLTTFSGAAVAPEGFARVVASIGMLTVYLVPLAALAYGFDAVVGDEESGWLPVLLALPVSRTTIILGTFLGRATILTGAIIIGFGIPGLLLLGEYGTAGWGAYVWFLGFTTLLGLVFLSLGVLASAVVADKAHALGLALLAWAWFVLVHDLLSFGVIAAFSLAEHAIIGMVLLNPTGLYRVLVLGELGASGTGGFGSVTTAVGIHPWLLVCGLLVWVAVPMAGAVVAIRRRQR